MPNPTPPAEVDVAEGLHLLNEEQRSWRAHEDARIRGQLTRELVDAAQDANEAWDNWALQNAPALLRAASENVSLREQVVSANEQRDAAVREVEAMKRLLAELADNLETTTQDSFLRGGGWQGSEDCLGIERARATLAQPADGGDNG